MMEAPGARGPLLHPRLTDVYCKAFSVLQSLNKGSENYQVTLKHGLNHLRFCMDVYAWQASRGKKFLHENPWIATS